MKNRNKKKHVAVLFSGGLDSTFLLWDNLRRGNKVYPTYIELENNVNKTLVEKQQINLIIKELEKEFNVNIFVKYVSKHSIYGSSGNCTFPQPLIWLLSAPFSYQNYYDELQIGYINGDDAVMYIDELLDLYDKTKPFFKHHIPIKFPLLKFDKYSIMNELPTIYHHYIVSCEEPIMSKIGIKYGEDRYRFYKPCCRCVPCKKIISHDFYFSKIIENRYIDQLYIETKKDVENLEKNFINNNKYYYEKHK